MPTKVKELRQPTGVDNRTDPTCRACRLEPPRDTIRADVLWQRVLKKKAPLKVFKVSPTGGR